MQKLHIEQTRTTPEIKFFPDEKIFFIRGISSPEDVRAMYYPVIEWTKIFVDDIIEGALKEFGKESPVILDIDLSYFNSSSAKFLFDILTELKRLSASEVPVVVEWIYDIEDIDMKDAGADISQLVEMQLKFVPKPRKEQ